MYMYRILMPFINQRNIIEIQYFYPYESKPMFFFLIPDKFSDVCLI